jgi:hypothetical protein
MLQVVAGYKSKVASGADGEIAREYIESGSELFKFMYSVGAHKNVKFSPPMLIDVEGVHADLHADFDRAANAVLGPTLGDSIAVSGGDSSGYSAGSGYSCFRHPWRKLRHREEQERASLREAT